MNSRLVKQLHTSALWISLCLAAYCAQAIAQDDNPLQADKWKFRPLIVIASNAQDPLYIRVRQALQEVKVREAFRERDMVLYAVLAGQGYRNEQALTAKQTQALLAGLPEADLSESELPNVSMSRATSSAPPSAQSKALATVILIGKDGEQKFMAHELNDLQPLFELVDSMPMRKNEVK